MKINETQLSLIVMQRAKYFLWCVLALLVSCTGHDDPRETFERGDYEKAYALWMPLAREGNHEAQNYIGIHHYLGLGVTQDYQEAVKWFASAARAGFPDAQRNYGEMFQYGRGVEQDDYQAFMWYFAASQQKHEIAGILLEDLSIYKLTPNQQMHAKQAANEFITDPALRFTGHHTYSGD